MTKLSFDEVIEAIKEEREYQKKKWPPEHDRTQSLPGFMLIIRKELEEAENGWSKNVRGRDSSLSELIQVAATAIAALEQFGLEGNPH